MKAEMSAEDLVGHRGAGGAGPPFLSLSGNLVATHADADPVEQQLRRQSANVTMG